MFDILIRIEFPSVVFGPYNPHPQTHTQTHPFESRSAASHNPFLLSGCATVNQKQLSHALIHMRRKMWYISRHPQSYRSSNDDPSNTQQQHCFSHTCIMRIHRIATCIYIHRHRRASIHKSQHQFTCSTSRPVSLPQTTRWHMGYLYARRRWSCARS